MSPRLPTSPWFVVPDPRPDAELKLFCIPHAGRGASLFMPWRALLPSSIELHAVQLPGRERRMAEPPMRRISSIAQAVSDSMRPCLDRPYVMFGHSMGALVCYEACRALRRAGAPLPRALILSGRRGPTIPERDTPIHGLSDDAFIAAMCDRYNGIPQVILDQPDMLRMFLPVMRSDIEAIETYSHSPEPPLGVPFFIYGGREDPQIAPENASAWTPLTEKTVALREFPGGHFYLLDERESLVQALLTDIGSLGLPFADQRDRVSVPMIDDVAGAAGVRR